ncbi:MAG: vWA domain-containing protein [Planctomycetota bacterium]
MPETTQQIVLESGLAWWHLAAAVGVGVVVVVQSYAWLVSSLAWRKRAALIGLRLGWTLLLLWCVFQPAIERTTTEEVRREPRVMVAVDRSASITLANAAEEREGAVDAIDAFLEAAEIDHVERYAIGANLRPWAEGSHDVESAARAVVSVTPNDGAEADAAAGKGDERSNLMRNLAQLADRSPEGQDDTVLLLVSDGQDTEETPVAEASRPLSERGISVFPVRLEALSEPPPIVRIETMVVPESVRPKQTAEIGMQVRLRGGGKRELLAILEELPADLGGAVELVRQPVPVGLDGTAQLAFDHRFERIGVNRLRGRLVDAATSETLSEAFAVVNVAVKSTVRVLYVQGALGWEFRHFRQAMADNPAIRVDAISRLGRRAILTQADGQVQGTRREGTRLLGLVEDSLDRYDVIVLGDLDPGEVRAEDEQRLLAMVREQGVGVLFFSGNHTRATRLSGTLLEQLLPVQIDPKVDRTAAIDREAAEFVDSMDRRFRMSREPIFSGNRLRRQQAEGGPLANLSALTLTRAGLASPIWRDADAQVTIDAPPATYLHYTRVARVKPGATVLGVTESGSEPLLVIQDIGSGRSAFLGVDGLWRWRMATDSHERGYDRFWQQLIEYLAARTVRDAVQLDRYVYETGDVARVTIRLDRGSGASTLRVQVPGQTEPREVPLTWSADGAQATAEVPLAQPGSVRFILDNGLAGRAAGVTERIAAVRSRSLEAEYAGANDRVLERLASATGGMILGVDELDSIRSLLQGATVEHQVVERATLWRWPWLIGVMLMMYVAELVLRQKQRLS